ncbi:CBS domain-containing protein [Evansella sp. AB-rgal1]|uniref:CBS domain-containing protein n=1 Tax=Evansella sp. AB-rgal1 TaxID=3242696 RepID=UPI00359E30F4
MKVIVSHTNLDFDGIASMIAAKKLYPQAELVLPSKISSGVHQFLSIYKDTFRFKRSGDISWSLISEVIIVDTNQLSRLGDIKNYIKDAKLTIYDHHPEHLNTIKDAKKYISSVGATITIISEQLQQHGITITPFDATVFALGLYSDTGAFTYEQTTSRDLFIGGWLLDNGANLSVVEQFRESSFSPNEQSLFYTLLENSESNLVDDTEIVISSHTQVDYTGNLAYITRKLLHASGADAFFSIVKMGDKVFITARSSSDRINVLPIIENLNGGGHEKAASAMQKYMEVELILDKVRNELPAIVKPNITAENIMTSPVRVVAKDTTIEDASKMLYRYGHTGFPVVEENKIIGVISRRDIDKALHHGFGHAPVKGYMSRNVITIEKTASIDFIQDMMIKKQVGRLPVVNREGIIGIVSRTDIIQAMHGKKQKDQSGYTKHPNRKNIKELMEQLLPSEIIDLFSFLGKEASSLGMKAYLIGGIVRDILLKKKNEDIDIVLEGDGIRFAYHLQEKIGGHIRSHEEFQTATWKHPSGLKVDLTSARTEYYDFPAALPKVELSTIKEDLLRRDFTINAMAICIHQEEFGDLLDYFNGYEDLNKKKINILYNLSFVEDPTRILRAIRFENRFDFFMDKQTQSFAKEAANNLISVSKQRISNELSRLFFEENPVKAIDRILQLGILPFLIKQSESDFLIRTKTEQLYSAIFKMKKEGIPISNSIWIIYLSFVTSMNETSSWTEVLSYCFKKEEQKLIKDFQLLCASDPLRNVTDNKLSNYHQLFSEIGIDALLAYFSVSPEKLALKGQYYIIKREKLTRKIDGTLLKSYGVIPGPLFKEILLYSEQLQLDNPEYNVDQLMEKVLLFYEHIKKDK